MLHFFLDLAAGRRYHKVNWGGYAACAAS